MREGFCRRRAFRQPTVFFAELTEPEPAHIFRRLEHQKKLPYGLHDAFHGGRQLLAKGGCGVEEVSVREGGDHQDMPVGGQEASASVLKDGTINAPTDARAF